MDVVPNRTAERKFRGRTFSDHQHDNSELDRDIHSSVLDSKKRRNFYGFKMRKSNRIFYFSFLFFCIIPTAVTFIYNVLVATPSYRTTFKATYQSYSPPTNLASTASSGVFATMGSAVDLSSIIYSYIFSPAILMQLDQKLDLRSHFSSKELDYFSRLSPDSDFGNFFDYYKSSVTVNQGIGGFIEVSVESAYPQFAIELSNAIIENCDDMLRRFTDGALKDEVRSAQLQLDQSKQKLLASRVSLAKFQNEFGIIDPEVYSSQLGNIVSQLELSITIKSADRARLAVLTPNSPQLLSLDTEIKSLKMQIAEINERIAQNGNDRSIMTNLIKQYSQLKTEEEIAKTDYMAASQWMVTSASNSVSKFNYLVVFAPPIVASPITYQRTLFATSKVFFGTILILVISSLLFGVFGDQVKSRLPVR